MEASEVALGCLVVASRDSAPRLQLVDQAFDGVAAFVELGVVREGPSALTALLLAVRGLVGLLRNHSLDFPSAQIGAIGAGGVRLVAGDRVGSGTRAADRPPDLDLLQDRDEPGAVGGLPLSQEEGERAAARIGSEMNLSGQTATRTAQQGRLQTGPASPPDAPLFLPNRVGRAPFAFGLRLSFLPAAPFDASAAFSRDDRTSSSICIPAAS